MRLKRILITPQALVKHLGESFYASNVLPSGASVCNVAYDAECNIFHVVVEHNSFEDISAGAIIPLWNCIEATKTAEAEPCLT